MSVHAPMLDAATFANLTVHVVFIWDVESWIWIRILIETFLGIKRSSARSTILGISQSVIMYQGVFFLSPLNLSDIC